MKQIWAPWRMEYILNSKEPGCFMCDMFQADDDCSNLLLYRGNTCAILMNRYPYNNGHLMVAPYRHIDSMEALEEREMTELMTLTVKAVSVLKTAIKPEGFNIGINLGSIAGAGLKDHIHMHIVPRWGGDTNFMPVLADVKVVPQHLMDLMRVLKELFINESPEVNP
ncbi:MAG: HIT domain-containing protein [Lentisphaerae bacterium]|nr:HIT domain-containing protein [Lentisphaerota bacterium]